MTRSEGVSRIDPISTSLSNSASDSGLSPKRRRTLFTVISELGQKLILKRLRFRLINIALAKGQLTMEIAQFNAVRIDQGQVTHAAPQGTELPLTLNLHSQRLALSLAECLLTRQIDFWQQNLPRVALQQLVIQHCQHPPVTRGRPANHAEGLQKTH